MKKEIIMPTYEHKCSLCDFEWDEMYSIKADPPTLCPSCKIEGMVQRLVSGGSGRGIVPLKGIELKAKIKEDAENIKREVRTNEALLANIVGEEKYHRNELNRAQVERETPKQSLHKGKIIRR